MLRAGQGLEELDTKQGRHRVGQNVLDGAGRCGNAKDEYQGKVFNVAAVKKKTLCKSVTTFSHLASHRGNNQVSYRVMSQSANDSKQNRPSHNTQHLLGFPLKQTK